MSVLNKGTYKNIQVFVKKNYGFTPKTCWIADIKEKHGLTTRKAPNRKGIDRKHPCPEYAIEPIEHALHYFKMIKLR